jgi:predicted phosphate transport protein (TIGR00153 family)
MIKYGLDSAKMLEKIVNEYDYNNLSLYKSEMKKLEHAADMKKHEMMRHLMKEFLPPIDREDISEIAHVLDEICDAIEEVVLLLYMYDIKACRDDVSEFIIIIKKECEKLSELFRDFENHKRNRDKLLNIIKEVNTIEEDGDRFYINVMKKLFVEKANAKDIVAWRDIYNCLEICCDCCEKVADAVENVIMKCL